MYMDTQKHKYTHAIFVVSIPYLCRGFSQAVSVSYCTGILHRNPCFIAQVPPRFKT